MSTKTVVYYIEDDLTNAFIKFQELIKQVARYNAKLKERIATKAHECLMSVDNLEKVRANFVALDALIEQVQAYNPDLQADLSDESDVCFNIAAEIAGEGGEE